MKLMKFKDKFGKVYYKNIGRCCCIEFEIMDREINGKKYYFPRVRFDSDTFDGGICENEEDAQRNLDNCEKEVLDFLELSDFQVLYIENVGFIYAEYTQGPICPAGVPSGNNEGFGFVKV